MAYRVRNSRRNSYRKESMLLAKAQKAIAMRKAGSFNETYLAQIDPKYVGAYKVWVYNEKTKTRSLRHGDFHSPTPYRVESAVREGCAMFYFDWFYDNGRTHASGFGSRVAVNTINTWWGGVTDTSPTRQQCLNTANKALLNKVTKELATWDLATDVAELGQTTGLLKSLAKRIRIIAEGVLARNPRRILSGFGVAATRRRRSHVARVLHRYSYEFDASDTTYQVVDVISELYLSYRYGLKPLMYSIDDSMRVLASRDVAKKMVFESQVTIPGYYFKDNREPAVMRDGLTTINHQSVVCEGSVRKFVRYSFTNSFSQALGGSAIGALKSVYELTKFSFLFDWFVDIGGWLDRLNTQQFTAETVCYITEKATTVRTSWIEIGSKAEFYKHKIVGSPGSRLTNTNFYFQRYVSSLSAGSVSFRDGLLSFNQSMDAIALLWQGVKAKIELPFKGRR